MDGFREMTYIHISGSEVYVDSGHSRSMTCPLCRLIEEERRRRVGEDLLTDFLYGYSLVWRDEEAGDSVNGPGHWCLIRSPLLTEDFDEEKSVLRGDQIAALRTAIGCIVHQDTDGSRDVTLYDTEEELQEEWNNILRLVVEFESDE
jgi:hypothetical protein